MTYRVRARLALAVARLIMQGGDVAQSRLTDRRTTGTPDPAEAVTDTFGGNTFRAGRRTFAHLRATDDAIRAQHPGRFLRVIQGCYSTGVAASAGTHDFDGCLDVQIVGMSWRDAERFLRTCGWAAWYRYPPTFSEHIHMVSIGCPGPVGAYVPGQVSDYYANRTGLAGHAADSSWHPVDIDSTVFDYPAWIEENDVTPDQQKQLDRIEKTQADISKKLDDLDKVLARITKSKREVISAVKDDK